MQTTLSLLVILKLVWISFSFKERLLKKEFFNQTRSMCIHKLVYCRPIYIKREIFDIKVKSDKSRCQSCDSAVRFCASYPRIQLSVLD